MYNVYKVDKIREAEFTEELFKKKSFGDRTKIRGNYFAEMPAFLFFYELLNLLISIFVF